jgi:N-acetylneuraminic acid mutarotase
MHRRAFVSGGLALCATSALAQHEHHQGQFERLNQPGRIDLPELHKQHAVTDSPAPKAAQAGRWEVRAPLPIPRTEMAWAAERGGKMHLVGGYAEQRVDRPYHHVYDPAMDIWREAEPLPRGANHVGVATIDGKLYAIGGFIDQNRKPHPECFVFGAEGERWSRIRPLPRALGAIGCVAVNGLLHAIGGAEGDLSETRKSVATHLAYDPREDSWRERRPMPTGRDHVGTAVVDGVIHLTGGRVDTFYTNSHYHHAYDPREDRWTARAPIPTARSGHGSVFFRGRVFIMGGEGSHRVYGQNEAYDPATDSWAAYAPMLTPRHGMGAVVLGDWVHVAGGGPQMGGGVKSAIHEAFSLG